jgi:hypothetical protein
MATRSIRFIGFRRYLRRVTRVEKVGSGTLPWCCVSHSLVLKIDEILPSVRTERRGGRRGPGGDEGDETDTKDIVDGEDRDTDRVDVIERHGGDGLTDFSPGTVHGIIVTDRIGAGVGLESEGMVRKIEMSQTDVTEGSVERRKTSPLKKMTMITKTEFNWAITLRVGECERREKISDLEEGSSRKTKTF